ncbi:MAG: hypothetical protein RL213_1602 [Bacteroidota bacterium]|jgi:putative ABC transport system ATP-binding protein
MISLQHIGRTFHRGAVTEVVALKDISLEIADGEYVIVLGANGSGKSTLLNTIAGTSSPDSGSVTVDGSDITSLPEHIRARWISRIFQDPLKGTSPELTLLENLRLAALRTKRKSFIIGTGQAFRRSAAERVATLGLGLENKMDQPVGTLSGGQRQALSLLMAVMDDTRILLMDEPTAALDPRTATTVLELADRLIRQYRLTALMITHQLKDAIAYGDRILVLSEGRIVADLAEDSRKSLQVSDLLKWFGG